MLADGGSGVDDAIGEAAHQLDPAARGVGFVAGGDKSWAGGETETAVHAGEGAVVGAPIEAKRREFLLGRSGGQNWKRCIGHSSRSGGGRLQIRRLKPPLRVGHSFAYRFDQLNSSGSSLSSGSKTALSLSRSALSAEL